jgi:hypothetical protein
MQLGQAIDFFLERTFLANLCSIVDIEYTCPPQTGIVRKDDKGVNPFQKRSCGGFWSQPDRFISLIIPPIIDILDAQIPRWHTLTSLRNRSLAYTLSQLFPQLYNPWE